MKLFNIYRMFGRIFYLLIASSVFLVSACSDSKGSAVEAGRVAEGILIEGVVVSNKSGAKEKDIVEVFMQEKNFEVKKISKRMSGYFSSDITINTSQAVLQNGLIVPALIYNGKPLNNDHALPQKLSQETDGIGVATIFVKAEEDFLRISTSLKRNDSMSAEADANSTAAGSTLSRTHPAYKACRAGNTYSGTATLFGKIYTTEYKPIFDKYGKVIGIQFVGLDITSDVAQLKKKLGVS
jgi:methyl-accepting chemotaxis protein